MFKRKKRFPTFSWILLVVAILWLLSEMGTLRINIPWLPLILVIIALGMVINRTG